MSIDENVWNRPLFEGSAEAGSATDCPECLVPGSVLNDQCQVCYAELDELEAS